MQDVIELDLGSLKSVKKCAETILNKYSQINILINNAGVSVPTKLEMKTEDGFEINFGVNHLGHFLLTYLLIERLKASAPSKYNKSQLTMFYYECSLTPISPFSRVIIVSSRLHEQGILDWEAFEGIRNFELGKRGPNAAYCSSKLANVLFGMKLAHMLKVLYHLD